MTPRTDHHSQSPSRRRGRWLRICLRWVGVLVAFGVVVVLLLAFYLNRVGLPDVVKDRLVATLREHGWVLQFSRLRLKWTRGIVAEDLQLQRTNWPAGPQFFIDKAECPLSHAALRNLEVLATSIRIEGGRVLWRVQREGRVQYLDLRDLHGRLSINPNDTWELHALRGTYQGLQLQLSGTLTNTSALQDWSYSREPAARPGALEAWLDQVESIVNRMHLQGTPELEGVIHGDARTFGNFYAGLVLRVAGLESPWGTGTNVFLSAQLISAQRSNETSHAAVRLTAEGARTPWAEARRLLFTIEFAPSWTQLVPTNAQATIEMDQADTAFARARQLRLELRSAPVATNALWRTTAIDLTAAGAGADWGSAATAHAQAEWIHDATNWFPLTGTGTLAVAGLETRWGAAESAALAASASLPPGESAPPRDRSWPDRFAHLVGTVDGTFNHVATPAFQTERSTLAAQWRAPKLRVQASAAGPGQLQAEVHLDTQTRDLDFHATGEVLPANVAPAFPADAREWLNQFICAVPPRVEASGRLVLPEHAPVADTWRTQVLATVSAAARLDVGPARFQQTAIDGFTTGLTLTNALLEVRELNLQQAGKAFTAAGVCDLRRDAFHLRAQSRIDPHLVRPFVPAARRALDALQFTVPPHVEAELRGNLRDWRTLAGTGSLTATNFTVNGEYAGNCRADLAYTNRFLSILQPELGRERGRAVADGLGIDLIRQRLHITNAWGDLNPYALLRAINTNTARVLSRYVFERAPTVTNLNGTVGLRAHDKAENLHLDIAGGPFHWHVFHLPHLTGHVYVLGETATLSEVEGQFYGGKVWGKAIFDWSGTNGLPGTTARFTTYVNNADLSALMVDVSSKPNQLEGQLNGFLEVEHLNSEDPHSWKGYGSLSLTNGLIWDFPVFGMVSRMLNGFVPGLGNSRAKEALGDFSITNSTIYTKNLEIRATGMRVHFKGAVGFDQVLDARVEAELLRDVPAIGFLVSKVFWPVTKLFVLKVTGTWGQPQAEPLYIIPNLVSKIVLVPFRPWSTLKNIFTPEEGTNGTLPDKPQR